LFLFAAVLAWMPGMVLAADNNEFSEARAKQVDLLLKRLAKEKRHKVFLKKVTLSQEDLNSYLNVVYIKRYTPEVKYIKLKLQKDNYVSGTLHIKLKGKNYEKIPEFLKDIEVETAGRVECENYRMRFSFETLSVNGTNFSPEVLDEAFGSAQSDYRIKKSMYDWFDLMPGIKKVVVDEKKVTLFY
jgi:hypothetical protein